VSIWDFAGQELYYASHQFFLSDRAIYIVVFDLRYDEEHSRVVNTPLPTPYLPPTKGILVTIHQRSLQESTYSGKSDLN
jgi:GTPase SAR1 family protein